MRQAEILSDGVFAARSTLVPAGPRTGRGPPQWRPGVGVVVGEAPDAEQSKGQGPEGVQPAGPGGASRGGRRGGEGTSHGWEDVRWRWRENAVTCKKVKEL